MSMGDLNDQIVPCQKCDDLIAIGKGHVTLIEQVGPGIKGVWYSHISEADCTPQTAAVQPERKGFGKPYVEIKIREQGVIENAGQKLSVISNDLAYMARGFNLDGMHDIASEAQALLCSVVYFREKLAAEDLDEYPWRELMAWSPPEEENDEKTTGDRKP